MDALGTQSATIDLVTTACLISQITCSCVGACTRLDQPLVRFNIISAAISHHSDQYLDSKLRVHAFRFVSTVDFHFSNVGLSYVPSGSSSNCQQRTTATFSKLAHRYGTDRYACESQRCRDQAWYPAHAAER